MQLASSGVRGLFGRRAITTNVNTGTHGANRSLHTPTIPRPHVSITSSRSAAQTIVNHTTSLFKAFFGHLTTPGTLRSSQPGAVTSPLFKGPPPGPTIQQRLSLPARHFLGRSLHAPYLPRPPTVPGNVTHVGLGVARNFSTARPIFQDLVRNVPITGRALLEADWEVKMNQERQKRRLQRAAAKKEKKRHTKKEFFNAKSQELSLKVLPESLSEEARTEELNHYFPALSSVPEVTTYLLIPLAPTPTSRVPLPPMPSPTSTHPLLPYSLIASLHTSHDTHALRVSSLFARLDGARVFDDPSVRCEARGDPSGLCTVLEVRFEGWEERRVRGVLGEAGTGWCVMEEVWKDREQAEREEMEDTLEKMSDAGVSLSGTDEFSPMAESLGDRFDMGMPRIDVDPSTSFVLPTLDFSASFPIQGGANVRRQDPFDDWTVSTPPTPASPAISSPGTYESAMPDPMADLAFHNAWTAMERASSPGADSDSMSDSLSDVSSSVFSSSSFGSPIVSPPLLSRRSSSDMSDSWVSFGFSSRFADRIGEVQGPGPREDPF